MPKVMIDGRAVEVPNGTLVVEAAKRVGIEIPVFCYHPKLQPVGMCRMCLVEIGTPKRGKDGQIEKHANGNAVIAWMPKLQTACTTVISDGMVVRTESAQVADARRSVIEFLLTSHPLDCPICDKGGECPLQNLTMAYGPGKSRFPVENKFHNEKRVPLGDLITLDRERCIQCSRCIRFQDELADDHVLGFNTRGRGMEIVSLSNPPFDSHFSGNTIDICPVGALTSSDFRLQARVWEVNDQSSICAHCSVGCNVLIGERDHEIKRIVPRENEAVNGIWICDKGRFVHHFATSPDRLSVPLVRKNGTLEKTSWPDALDFVSKRLGEIKAKSGAKSIGGLGGDRAANEDLYLFQKLFREVIGTNNLEHRVGWSATNTGVDLVRLYGAGVDTNLGALGKNVSVLVLGADPEKEQPVIRLRLTRSARQFGASLIVANPVVTKLSRHAKQSILYRYGTEAAFLMGMVRVILDENLENKDFIAARVTRFDSFKKLIELFTVERCSEMCGVSTWAIRNAARTFAQSPDGLVLYGREAMASQQRNPAVATGLAALLLVTGHLGRVNNGLIALYPHNNSTGAIDFGLMADSGLGRESLPEGAEGLAVQNLLSGGQLRALYVMACDPAADGTFRKPEFLVVQDLFRTETATMADVVLPAQSFAERQGTFTNTERRVQLFNPAVKPVGESKPDWWILAEVGARLGAKWSYGSPAQIFQEAASRVPLYRGMDYEKLSHNVIKPRPPYGIGNPSSEPTEIAMGTLDEVSSGIQWPSLAESDATAKFTLVWSEPRVVESKEGLTLVTERSLYDCGTLVGKTRIVQRRIPAPYVEVNSHDAEDLGIENGMQVNVSYDSKALQLSARVDSRVPPGVVLVPRNLEGTLALPMGVAVKISKV